MAAVGDAAVQFLEQLTCGSGSYLGQPLQLRPWQQTIVRELFGRLRPDGRRQYRRCYIWIPRKNGKTELAAALALYTLMGEREPGAQIYSAAADRANAALIFQAASNMVKADPDLLQHCTIIDSLKEIRYEPTQSFYRALSSEAYSKHGLNAHCIIYDELHAAPDRHLWDVLVTSQGARKQPLVIVISTAGYDRSSIGWEIYDYTRKVRDGEVRDESVLPVIYEAPGDADWRDERVWAVANPALGDFREVDELRLAAREAEAIPSSQNRFRQLYLNQWTEQHTRWLDLHIWDAQAGPRLTETDLTGRVCVAGLDLSSVSDLTSWVLVAGGADGLDILHRSFVPEVQLDRTRNPRNWLQYQQWAAAGYLLVTPGEAVDYAYIKARVLADCSRVVVRGVNVDRLFQGQQLTQELEAEGVPIYPMAQGFLSMSPAVKALETHYLKRHLHHGGDPVLRWCVQNAVVRTDPAGNLKVDKERSQEKVDPLVALVMALDRVQRGDLDLGGSVYEVRDLLVL